MDNMNKNLFSQNTTLFKPESAQTKKKKIIKELLDRQINRLIYVHSTRKKIKKAKRILRRFPQGAKYLGLCKIKFKCKSLYFISLLSPPPPFSSPPLLPLLPHTSSYFHNCINTIVLDKPWIVTYFCRSTKICYNSRKEREIERKEKEKINKSIINVNNK